MARSDVVGVPRGAESDSLATLSVLRVLLAEDSPINMRVVVRMLSYFGVSTDVAENGQEAVQLATQRPYDLVFMDMQMPVMDGVEATRLLRQRHGSTMWIVALTASTLPEDRELCRQAGCDAFLSKPFRLEDLRGILTRAAERVRLPG